MIQPALHFIASALNQFIRNKFGLEDAAVALNHIIEPDETVPLENKNKVVITLINIEYQTLKPFYVTTKRIDDSQYESVSPTQRFNLDILISSNFDDYSESLKFLGAAMLFFQINPSFDAEQYPGIPQGIDKLQLDIEQINYSEMHNLWSAMGAKYKPSIVYKTRMVSIQGDEVEQFDAAVTQTNISKSEND